MQTKKHSVFEAIVNTGSGYIMALAVSMVLYPAMGWPVTFAQANLATMVFTVLSLGRNYVIRRIFNKGW